MKILSVISAIAAFFTMMTASTAVDGKFKDGIYETTVIADFADSYTVTIPTEIKLRSKDESVEGTVTVSDLSLEDGFTLIVAAISEGNWLLSSDNSDTTLAYTATVDGIPLSSTYQDVLQVTNETGPENLSATMVFTLADHPVAGTFTDKLTFYAFVVPPREDNP